MPCVEQAVTIRLSIEYSPLSLLAAERITHPRLQRLQRAATAATVATALYDADQVCRQLEKTWIRKPTCHAVGGIQTARNMDSIDCWMR